MANYSGQGQQKEDGFREALRGKNVPVLTLDPKWYRLLDRVGNEDVGKLENRLNDLLKAQGKANTEQKEIKKLKKRLMEEMVTLADEARQGDAGAAKHLEENKRLVEDCNRKLAENEDAIVDLPREIDRVNKELLLITMEHCYETMQENTDEIKELSDWVAQVRVELKKNLIRKQEKEAKNHEIYSFMHDIFGAEVVGLFDLRYNPEQQHPRTPGAGDAPHPGDGGGNPEPPAPASGNGLDVLIE